MGILFEDPKQYNLPVTIKGLTNELYAEPKITFHFDFFFFAAASTTLYYRFEPKFYVNFRQSEVFFNCNIHHTS